MTEADFTSKFNTWLKHNPQYFGAFELKICKEESMPFSRVAKHQVISLDNVRNGHLIYKLPDTGFSQLPFDVIKLQNYPAYIAIMFYRRGCKTFYLIDINTWIDHVLGSKRKSITEAEAVEIGYTCVLA